MPGFRLTRKALEDVAEIIGFHHDRNAAHANSTEDRLFKAFMDIARYPEKGHRRSDLTAKNVMFHYVEPHFILFRRMKTAVQILRVAHKSRDLRRFI